MKQKELNEREIRLLIDDDANNLKLAPYSLRNNEEFVLRQIKRGGSLSALQYASAELLNSKSFMQKAIDFNGHSLGYASEQLRDDKELVLRAVKKNVYALQYASDRLKNDKEVVKTATLRYHWAMEFASPELQNDKPFVLEMIEKAKQGGFILHYVSDELKSDREVVLTAVKKNGYALEYASKELQNDREVAFEAVKNDFDSVKFVSKVLKNDVNFVYELAKASPKILRKRSADEESSKDDGLTNEVIYQVKKMLKRDKLKEQKDVDTL